MKGRNGFKRYMKYCRQCSKPGNMTIFYAKTKNSNMCDDCKALNKANREIKPYVRNVKRLTELFNSI